MRHRIIGRAGDRPPRVLERRGDIAASLAARREYEMRGGPVGFGCRPGNDRFGFALRAGQVAGLEP
jgi:hypothetical protein